MLNNIMYEEELKKIYERIRKEIEKRIIEFEKKKSDKEIFAEFVFCLLTPQSKAKACWHAVLNLIKDGLLFGGGEEEIEKKLKGIRFKNKKASYIKEARKFFADIVRIKDKKPNEAREWLVKNIKGMGYKEASHFLRNIGMGENFAILDRHILKNLKKAGVINKIPSSLTKEKYFKIEEKMKAFAKKINIPLNHLDLLLWYKETGEVFK